MDIQKRLQDFENELIDFSCYEDQLNDKKELLNCFNKLKEAINFIPCCTELCECATDTIYTGYNEDMLMVCRNCNKPLIA